MREGRSSSDNAGRDRTLLRVTVPVALRQTAAAEWMKYWKSPVRALTRTSDGSVVALLGLLAEAWRRTGNVRCTGPFIMVMRSADRMSGLQSVSAIAS